MHSDLNSGSCRSSYSGIPVIPRNFRNSAEHTSELNHSRARLICSGIPEGRTRDLCHNTIPYYHSSAICHTIQCCQWCGAWSDIAVVSTDVTVRRQRHPQPVAVDAETERQGRIRNIIFKVLMYTQLAVLNNQCLRDFDRVVLKSGPHIRKC